MLKEFLGSGDPDQAQSCPATAVVQRNKAKVAAEYDKLIQNTKMWPTYDRIQQKIHI
jgi:hypothetical protein